MTEADWMASDDPAAMLRHIRGRSSTHPASGATLSDPPLVANRKLRLFACACFRAGPRRNDQEALRVVEVHEEYADGHGSEEDMRATHDYVFRISAWNVASPLADWLEAELDYTDCPPATQAALLRDIVGNPWRPVTLCGMERKPFHNQFAHVDKNGGFWLERDCPACADILRWNDSLIPSLASRIYGNRDFDLMPVLADALEDAGCDDEYILGHCRNKEKTVCDRCGGDGKAHGADRPFEWSADVDYGKCVVCKGTGLGTGWRKLRGPHARGCWVLDLLLGKE